MSIRVKQVHLTAELLLQEEPEVVPAPRVRQQLPEAEGPALHPHLGGRLHAVETHQESAGHLGGGGRSADSLGCIQGPVCDVVSEPGVARATAGQEGVVAAVGGAVLHYSAEEQRGAAGQSSGPQDWMGTSTDGGGQGRTSTVDGTNVDERGRWTGTSMEGDEQGQWTGTSMDGGQGRARTVCQRLTLISMNPLKPAVLNRLRVEHVHVNTSTCAPVHVH